MLTLFPDITTHLNDLNVKLQGKAILVTDMHANITAFEVKMRLFEAHLANGQFVHFPRLATCVPDGEDLFTWVSVVASRRGNLSPVLQESGHWILTVHFGFLVDDAPVFLQKELVESQFNDELGVKFHISSRLSFFCDLALPSGKFPNYTEHIQNTVAMFGSTHC